MAAVEEALPASSDAAAAAAAASRAANSHPSPLRRAKDKIAAHVSAVSSLLAGHQSDVHVEFADAAIRSLQELLHGRCVPSTAIARLHRVSDDFSRDGQPGKRALSLLGETLRSMCVASNAQFSRADGLEPDEYGLPRPKMSPAKYDGESAENYSPGGTPSLSVQREQLEQLQHVCVKEEPMWDGEMQMEEEEGEDEAMWPLTRGQLHGPTGTVDLSRVAPIEREQEDEEEREAAKDKKKKQYTATAPPPPFEYKCDAAGNVMVKSEMLGEDDFFEHQLQQREWHRMHEAMAKGGMEERFITHHLMGKGARRGKIYECDQCDEICFTQHKFAAHKRYMHPRSPKELAEEKAVRQAKTAAAVALLAQAVPTVREKRERRAPPARDEMVSHSGNTPPAAAVIVATPAPSKMYTCQMCDEVCDTQHKFASHMRYKHPKGSAADSMQGRRAGVSTVQTASPSVSSPLASSPLVAAGSTMTPSGSKMTPAVCSYTLSTLSSPSTATPSSTRTTPSTMTPSGAGEGEQFTCKLCGRGFASRLQLGGHTGHCRTAHAAAAAAAAATMTPPLNGPSTSKATASGSKATSSSTKKKEKAVKEEEEGTPTNKTYTCKICERVFDNYNSVAGHTRHCRNAQAARSGASSPAAASPIPPSLQAVVASKMTSSAAASPTMPTLSPFSPTMTPSGSASTSKTTTPSFQKPTTSSTKKKKEKQQVTPSGSSKMTSSAPLEPYSPGTPSKSTKMTSSAASSASKTTSSKRKKRAGEKEVKQEEVEEGDEPKKSYSCHICTRQFDNYNGMAGHTRHCIVKNGGTPSPRALSRRVEKATERDKAVAAAAARVEREMEEEKPEVQRGGKKRPLPISPLALPPREPTGNEKKGEGDEEEKKETPKQHRKSTVPVKEEEMDEEEVDLRLDLDEEEEEKDRAALAAELAAREEKKKTLPRVGRKRPLPVSPLALPPRQPAGSEKKEVGGEKKEIPKGASVPVKEEMREKEGEASKDAAAAAAAAAPAATPAMARGKATRPFTITTRGSTRASIGTSPLVGDSPTSSPGAMPLLSAQVSPAAAAAVSAVDTYVSPDPSPFQPPPPKRSRVGKTPQSRLWDEGGKGSWVNRVKAEEKKEEKEEEGKEEEKEEEGKEEKQKGGKGRKKKEVKKVEKKTVVEVKEEQMEEEEEGGTKAVEVKEELLDEEEERGMKEEKKVVEVKEELLDEEDKQSEGSSRSKEE